MTQCSVVRIAMATKENMSRQRGALYQISNRMGGITSIFFQTTLYTG